jgi:hypothetical protein
MVVKLLIKPSLSRRPGQPTAPERHVGMKGTKPEGLRANPGTIELTTAHHGHTDRTNHSHRGFGVHPRDSCPTEAFEHPGRA